MEYKNCVTKYDIEVLPMCRSHVNLVLILRKMSVSTEVTPQCNESLLDLIFGEMSEEPTSRENQLLHIVATWHFSDQDDLSLFYQHISYINIIDLIDRSLRQILDNEKKRRGLRSTNLCAPRLPLDIKPDHFSLMFSLVLKAANTGKKRN